MDGKAGWWTTSGNIGLPPLARVMGVGRQQQQSVLDPIPHTQHRPICVTANLIIVPQPTTSRRRFNLQKANWDGVSTEFDAAIEEVNSIPENYGRFIELLRVVSRRHIPRGCRSNYIPGLREESKSIYEAYKRQYSSNPFGEVTLETGAKIIDTMEDLKRKKMGGGHHVD